MFWLLIPEKESAMRDDSMVLVRAKSAVAPPPAEAVAV